MADIKSAHEIAMEKVAHLGSVTEDERRQWKYVPEGEKLAAKYLKDGVSLDAALNEFAEEGRGYVARGVIEILIRNIDLPRNESFRKSTKQATARQPRPRQTQTLAWRRRTYPPSRRRTIRIGSSENTVRSNRTW